MHDIWAVGGCDAHAACSRRLGAERQQLDPVLFYAQGALHSAVVDAIRPFLAQLRSTPNGKRILSKINVKI